MPVTTEDFKKLTPIAYSAARSHLRTGDILLFSSHGGFSELIEEFTHSLWSHAAFVWNMEDIDRVLLLESIDTVGVRAVALSNRINGSSAAPEPYGGGLLVARHKAFPYPADPKRIGQMTRFAIDRLGYPYGAVEIAKIGLRIGAGLIKQKVPGVLEPENAYICSEYVAKCYAEMGIVIAPDEQGFMAPASIANDPDVYPIFALCPDPR